MHGFTHAKSVPHLFSTPQTRSQQQTGIFAHLLKKLAPVNEISGVLSLVDPMWIFSPLIWEELQFYGSCACANKISKQQYRTMLCEISTRRSLLEPSFRCLSPGREGEKCRPLNHTWQIPCVHSAYLPIAHALLQKHYKSCVVSYGTRWCIVAQSKWHSRMCICCTYKIVRHFVSFSLALVKTL